MSDTKVYEPQTRAPLGIASYFCGVVVLKLRTVPIGTALSSRILRVIRTASLLAGSKAIRILLSHK